jgi:hypothetical protein
VQAHELQGVYAQWRPATMPGYELVEQDGRAFVLLPAAAAPAAPFIAAPAPVVPARKSGGRWAIVGVVVFVVLAVTAVALAFALAPAAKPSSAAPTPGEYRSFNVTLLGIQTGDCARLPNASWTDPFEEIKASRAPCERAADIHYVTSTHESIPREQVKDNVYLCATTTDGKRLAVWASWNGLFGTLVCFGAAEG